MADSSQIMKSIDANTGTEKEQTNILNEKLKLLEEQKVKIFVPKSNLWIASAFISCFLFASSNFFLSLYSDNWAQTRELAYVGIFMYSVTYFGVKFLLSNDSQFFAYKSSMFYDVARAKFNYNVAVGVIVSTFFQVVTGYTTIFAMEFSECAGINKGVITTLFAFNSVLMSIYSQ